MNEYIYESQKNNDLKSEQGIIIFPDIYSQTDYSKRTVEQFAEAFKQPVFMFDYFYINTKRANNFSENESEVAHGLLQNFKGDELVAFFRKVMNDIKEKYPEIKEFSALGFCFGGRLAYIAGGEQEVSKVFSFYGAGANTPNYVEGKSPIEYLISKKRGSQIKVDSFFGTDDPVIPEEDREKIKELMLEAQINYTPHEYKAGHAYFQDGRKNFNKEASEESSKVLKSILNG